MDSQTESQTMEVDIACVGFGPAVAGFLNTITKAMVDDQGQPILNSSVMPGAPLQILCYERADDIGFGVSGVVTRGRSIRESFPDLNIEEIPMACPVSEEKVLYLLDPIGASKRSPVLKGIDKLLNAGKGVLPVWDHAFQLPYIPPFLSKEPGMNPLHRPVQPVDRVAAHGFGPGTDLARHAGFPSPFSMETRWLELKLVDQGVEKDGTPGPGYLPGMNIRAGLTVVGDGPFGSGGARSSMSISDFPRTTTSVSGPQA